MKNLTGRHQFGYSNVNFVSKGSKEWTRLLSSGRRAGFEIPGKSNRFGSWPRALVAQALEDLRDRNLQVRNEALFWIMSGTPDFAIWCGVAELDAEAVREEARRRIEAADLKQHGRVRRFGTFGKLRRVGRRWETNTQRSFYLRD
ncbi:MAG: hypothetical protein AB1898_27690 [Acidobacteriota bacterium]